MSLQEFINKNKEELGAELRCGSCGNSLAHCGKYTIEKVGLGKGKRSEEGILCETCSKQNRKLVRVTRVIESPTTAIKQVANFLISDIDTKQVEEREDQIEKFKKIEAESVTNPDNTKVFDEKTLANDKLKEKETKDKKED